MSGFVCRKCGGELQATVKRYCDVDGNTGGFVSTLHEEDVDIYCDNDHQGAETGFQLAPDALGVVPIEE